MLIDAPAPQTLGGRMAEWLEGRHAIPPERLRAIVTGRHDLDGWVDRIVAELADLADAARRKGATR
jgi:hypothetical protein